jgi:ribosomal protein S28E/S33
MAREADSERVEVRLTTGGKGAVNRMEIDVVHGKDKRLIFRGG